MQRTCLEDSKTLPCQALSRINRVVICTAFFDANSIIMIPRARTEISSVLMQEFFEGRKILKCNGNKPPVRTATY